MLKMFNGKAKMNDKKQVHQEKSPNTQKVQKVVSRTELFGKVVKRRHENHGVPQLQVC